MHTGNTAGRDTAYCTGLQQAKGSRVEVRGCISRCSLPPTPPNSQKNLDARHRYHLAERRLRARSETPDERRLQLATVTEWLAVARNAGEGRVARQLIPHFAQRDASVAVLVS